MNRRHVITVIFTASILILGLTKAAQAAMVTYRLEGVIQQSVVPVLIEGASYSATLLFDPSQLTSSPDPLGGLSYSFASFSFTSGATSLSGQGISIAIENDDIVTGKDVVRIGGGLTGSFAANLRINLLNNDGTLFNSNAFPDPFPTLADFDFGQLLINTSTTNFASLDVFAPVPLPAALYLFGSALLGLVAVKRKKA